MPSSPVSHCSGAAAYQAQPPFSASISGGLGSFVAHIRQPWRIAFSLLICGIVAPFLSETDPARQSDCVRGRAL